MLVIRIVNMFIIIDSVYLARSNYFTKTGLNWRSKHKANENKNKATHAMFAEHPLPLHLSLSLTLSTEHMNQSDYFRYAVRRQSARSSFLRRSRVLG